MRTLLILIPLLLTSLFTFAQPGRIDTTFNTFDDGTYGDGTGFQYQVNVVVTQADGKIIVAGGFSTFNGFPANKIVRLDQNGHLDPTFSVGTGFNSDVLDLEIQPDGKIVVGGWFTSFNGVSRNKIARLNSDGSLDPSFTVGSGFSTSLYTWVSDVALQSNGKIIAVGEFSSYNGSSRNKIVCLNPNGSIDLSFTQFGFNETANVAYVQQDGKILIGGGFWTYGGNTVRDLVRLNPDGTLDSTFLNAGFGGFSDDVFDIVVQPDGKIVACGYFWEFDGTNRRRIARLNADGTLDTGFNPGIGFEDPAYTVSLQTDGKIIVGGEFISFNGVPRKRITRLNTDGSMDASFNFGEGCDDMVFATCVESDGKILVGGRFDFFNGELKYSLARLNPDGSLISSFNPAAGFNDKVHTTLIQPDGKVLVGGNFNAFNGKARPKIARLNSDGSLDESFNPSGGFNNEVYAIALQADNKMIVAGKFTMFNGSSSNRIVRLNPDGSVDLTFNIGTGFNGTARTIAIQSDGKILVGGEFTSYNGATTKYFVRLNPDGSIDPTLVVGTGFSSFVYQIVVNESDDRITVAGFFTTYNNVSISRIARLNNNGTLDATFATTGTGFNNGIRSIALQPDGKTLIAGSFTQYNGATNNYIARLNYNGSVDPTFNTGTGLDGTANSIALQSDGKIIIGGEFLTFNGFSRNRIVRLNADGTFDPVFNPGTGFNNIVRSLAIQSDGNIIAGGDFGSFDGYTKNRILRLLGNCLTISDNSIITNVSCVNGSNGSISFAPTGGFAPYSYYWSNGANSNSSTGLTAGLYTITITDAIGCSKTFNKTVSEPSITLSGTQVVTNVSCWNGTNGSIDLTPIGGTAPYAIDWGNGITTEDRSGLTAGVYHVTISDTSGCAILSIPITQPDTSLHATVQITNVNCFNGSDGAIDLIPDGGTSPYTYSWNNGDTLQDISELTSGVYTVNLTDSLGCTTSLSATITQPAAVTNSFTVSNCYSHTWNSQTYSSSGDYTQNFTTVNGCDSTVTMHLTINHSTSGTFNHTVCNPFNFYGTIYDTSGTYIINLQNVAGCDSVLTLNLTVNSPSSGSISDTSCGNYFVNGELFFSSGTYTQHLINAEGCDSVLTLNLTILPTTYGTVTQTACGFYNYHGSIYTSSGTYYQYLTNSNGCDSLVTLNLTINNTTIQTINVTACDSYSFNGQIYTTSGTYEHNFTNSSGCDSTIILVLGINDVPDMMITDNGNGTITASNFDFYQWIDCSTGNIIAGETSPSYSPAQNGTYAVIGTTLSPCSDTSECIEINYLDVNKKTQSQISLVPNPTEDIVSIFFNKPSAQLMVRDSQGKQILYKLIMSGEQISLQNYADGVYLFEIKTDESSTTHKILKQ